MRIRSPISRSSFSIRFALFDVIWAIVAPWLALWVRGAQPIVNFDPGTVVPYCVVAVFASLLSFVIFRIRDGMTHLFSVHDAIALSKAVLMTECLTFLFLFTVTRLEGIPRSTPVIHALILSAGLLCARAFVRMYSSKTTRRRPSPAGATEHVILVGSNRLSALCMELLQTYDPRRYQFVAIVDDDPAMLGRSVGGRRVIGSCALLPSIVEEFEEHGIRIDRILIGGDATFLSEEALESIEALCGARGISCDFVPHFLHLDAAGKDAPQELSSDGPEPEVYAAKRYVDFVVAIVLLVALLPLLLLTCLLVLLDVGYPVFYWQRRVGLNGATFQLHKFRTLKPGFDSDGTRIASKERMSAVGAAIRRSRLDELPQLLNVLVGDMSLVGPRPLLPEDQPRDPRVRLSVRPGVTGWAQINGGTSLTPDDKARLDEWYVRNASFALDLRILLWTVVFLLRGDTPRGDDAGRPARSSRRPAEPHAGDELETCGPAE